VETVFQRIILPEFMSKSIRNSMSTPKFVGCTYESPISIVGFIAAMPEVHAMITCLAAIGIAITGLVKDWSLVIPVLSLVVGAAVAHRLARGGTSSLLALEAPLRSDRPIRAIVTGASSGIGAETAKELVRRGIYVTLAVRDVVKGEAVAATIAAELASARSPAGATAADVRSRIDVAALDLASLQSVRRFATAYLARGNPALDILICNAGCMLSRPACIADAAPDRPVDVAFASNVLGHVLLTTLLFRLILTSGTRIVTLSSAMHLAAKTGPAGKTFNVTDAAKWDPPAAYATGKLGSIWLARSLQRRIDSALAANPSLNAPKGRACAVSVHPGTVWTPFHMPFYLDSPFYVYTLIPLIFGPIAYFSFKSPAQGVRTTLHCALSLHPLSSPESAALAGEGAMRIQPGQLYMDCRVCPMSAAAASESDRENFWVEVRDLIGHVKVDKETWDLCQ
jgi:NAD(P)-dependent dehydrogenase (short-subunit alcohol dehydrogenase family)